MATLEQMVTEKVGAALGELMPQDQWEALVGAAFKVIVTRPAGYRGEESPSPLEKLTQQAVEKAVAERLVATLASPEWSTKVDGLVSERVSALIAEHADGILRRLMERMVQGFVTQAVYETRGGR